MKNNVVEKPEVKITNWFFESGALYGDIANHPRFGTIGDYRVTNILKRTMNPKTGDQVESLDVIYVLTGEGVTNERNKSE